MFAAMTDAPAGNREPTSESLEIIRNFAEIEAKLTRTCLCGGRGVTAVVSKVFARHKGDLVGALCP